MKRPKPKAAADDASIVGEIRGRGPGVLFFHGWNHSKEIWRPVVDELEDERTAVTVDLPGYGDSPPLSTENMTLSYYSALTSSAIEEVKQVLAARGTFLRTVVGDSLGAIFLLEILKGPDNTSREGGVSVNLSFKTNGAPSFSRSGKQAKRLEFEGEENLVLSGCPSEGLPPYIASVKRIQAIRVGLSALHSIPEWMSRRLIRVLSLGTVRRYRHVNDDLVDSVMKADPETSQYLFQEIADYTFGRPGNGKSQDDYTVHVVRGERDRITSKSKSQLLARKLKGTYEEIPAVGHTPMIENPTEYASITRKHSADSRKL